jgi:hypothetical protein
MEDQRALCGLLELGVTSQLAWWTWYEEVL